MSKNVAKVTESRSMRWVGYVAHRRNKKCTQNFGYRNLRKETTQKM